MKSLAFVQTKGGSGKSTAAINVAVAASVMTSDAVLLVDTDPQSSSLHWAQLRTRAGLDTISARPADLYAVLAAARTRYDLCVVDTAGHDVRALQTTIRAVDHAIIVSRPTILDVHVAMNVRNVLQEHGCGHSFLLTQVPNQVGERLESWNRNYREVGAVVSPSFGYLMDFQDALALGLGVVEYRSRGRAAQQVAGAFECISHHLEHMS